MSERFLDIGWSNPRRLRNPRSIAADHRNSTRSAVLFLSSAFCLLLSALCILPSLAAAQSRPPLEDSRNRMVEDEIIGAGITNARVIQAMRDTPRHEFVQPQYRGQAYYDMSLPIGEKQTI